MEETIKYKKEQFQIQTQISHVTDRAYDGEKLDKIRQLPIRQNCVLGSAPISIPVPVTKRNSKYNEISPKLINKHTPQLGVSCISRPAPFSFKGGIFMLNSRHRIGDLVWICSRVGRAQSSSNQMSWTGSYSTCPAVHGWHGPGVSCQPVMLPAQENPMAWGCMLPGTRFLPDHHAICASGKAETPDAAMGAQSVGWNLLIVSKGRIWSFAERLSPCRESQRGQLVHGKS